MGKPNRTVNAGVHGAAGIEFQKHCALYLLFEEYDNLNDTKYFICIEHKDDFLFCYQDKEGLVHSIDCYQAKKSSTPWTLSQELLGLVGQMTGIGLELHEDIIPKTEKYEHKLIFITNNSITLNNGSKKGDVKKTVIINESNNQKGFIDLDKEISNHIKTKVESILREGTRGVEGLEELEKISMKYIDIPKTSKGQKVSLIGKCNIIFGDKISDHEAAVDTMLLLFRDVEITLNQGNISKLMDESKRIDCQVIKNGFNLLTTKKMAFNLWRQEKNRICKKLNIPISKQASFKLDFENSFDRFKDLEQREHIKILDFVKKNKELFDVFTDEIECIQELCKRCEKTLSSQLSELSVKAAIYAAYIEEREVGYGD